MQRLIGLVFVVLMVLAGVFFVRGWRKTTPLGVGTGDIAGKQTDLAARDNRGLGKKTRSKLSGITDNPTRYKDKKVTVSGRVRGVVKLASNRYLYPISDGTNRIMVFTDKTPPKEYWPATVNGTVKVIGPPVGGLQYAYLADVKNPVKYNAPTWAEIKDYFTKSPNR